MSILRFIHLFLQKYNFVIIYLDLTGNEIAEETVQAVEVAVMRNRDVNSLKDRYPSIDVLLCKDY